jgi:hypothetical protein
LYGPRSCCYRSDVRRLPADLLIPGLLFLFVLATHSASRVATSFDSRWTVPGALSLLRHGDVDLNEYEPLLRADNFYSLECIDPQFRPRRTQAELENCSGRYFPIYPSGTTFLATPFVAALEVLVRFAPKSIGWSDVTRAFFAGDFVTGRAVVEVLIASFLIAIAAVAIYAIAVMELPRMTAVGMALLFAFCTSAWSTGSRALWQHGPSMLMLSLALYLLIRAERNPQFARYAGIPLACAYVIRPTNSIPILLFTLYVLLRFRREFFAYLLCASPAAALFFAYNYAVYRSLFSGYYAASPDVIPALGSGPNLTAAFLGGWISPSRGLLVFTPVFALSLYGWYLGVRRRWHGTLPYFLGGIIMLHWILISLFPNWWGGHAYGPRYFTDITPVFVVLLIPVVREMKARTMLRWAFVVLCVISFFIHYRGATSWEVYRWNVEPSEASAERAWDWSDPQILRGLR